MSEAREFTQEEVQTQFLNYVRMLSEYWLNDSRTFDVKKKLDGLAFSILTMLDGGAADMPAFAVIPNPHPDDKGYRKAIGANYYPDFNENDEAFCNIAGSLHDRLHRWED